MDHDNIITSTHYLHYLTPCEGHLRWPVDSPHKGLVILSLDDFFVWIIDASTLMWRHFDNVNERMHYNNLVPSFFVMYDS